MKNVYLFLALMIIGFSACSTKHITDTGNGDEGTTQTTSTKGKVMGRPSPAPASTTLPNGMQEQPKKTFKE